MIEIHSHILYGLDDGAPDLPGLDDGAPDLAAAQQLARDYIAQGVSDVVCTPHLTTEHSQTPATLDWYLEKRNTVQAQLSAWLAAENLPLKLHQGAELLISSATLDILQNDTWREQITLAQSDYILVELPSVLAGGYKALDQILFNIQILAHHPTRRPVQNHLARQTLATRYGPQRAETWTHTNPAKILNNDSIV